MCSKEFNNLVIHVFLNVISHRIEYVGIKETENETFSTRLFLLINNFESGDRLNSFKRTRLQTNTWHLFICNAATGGMVMVAAGDAWLPYVLHKCVNFTEIDKINKCSSPRPLAKHQLNPFQFIQMR